MKILQVIPYFAPAWNYGGSVSSVYNVSKELVKRGHSVTVYTTDTLDSKNRIKKNEETIEGVEVKRFKNWSNNIASKHRIFWSPGMFLEIKQNLKTFDIVHMNEFRSFQNVFVHHYARKYDIPYVLQAHGSLPIMMSKKLLKRLYDISWGRKLLRDASKVIALTQAEVKQYENVGISLDMIEVLSNGIDLQEFSGLPEKGEFRRGYGLDSHKLILYLGRIHKIKGLGILAKAFASLAREVKDVNLVIAGPDDGYLTELKSIIKELSIEERVILPGPLYGHDKLQAYVDADVCVLPSSYEIFSIGLIESLACGTPVVVTDCCGLADVVREQAGLVVPFSGTHLRAALQLILTDDKMRQKFGERGKLLISERFSWSKIVLQLEGIYKNCILNTKN